MLRQLAKQVNKCLDLTSSAKRCLTTTRLQRQEEKKSLEDGEKPVKESTVLVEKKENITMIGINRPQKRNAIDFETATKLCEAFSAFENDQTSPVAVLYGVGGSFCAGYDISELVNEESGISEVSTDILMSPEGSVGPTRRILQKPVVCGINGYCIANGLELALMCDLRVMEESAVLGFFNRRFGVPVIDGGTARLPAMIGISRALDLVLTGRTVCAKEAYEMGIANRIVSPGTVYCEALSLAIQLSKFPQYALIHDRKSLHSVAFDANTFNQAVQNEVMYTSKEIIEQMTDGIKWFNKRFKTDPTDSWWQKDLSMADWDDEDVAREAEKIQEQKTAEKNAKIEEERRAKEEKIKQKEEKKKLKAAAKKADEVPQKQQEEETTKKQLKEEEANEKSYKQKNK